MQELFDDNDSGIRSIYLTPEQASEKYQEAVDFLNKFYTNEFDTAQYMPVVKESHEYTINLLQFAINYITSFPEIPAQHRVALIVWALQCIFWIGYKEGKSEQKIDLPPGFFDALKDVQ